MNEHAIVLSPLVLSIVLILVFIRAIRKHHKKAGMVDMSLWVDGFTVGVLGGLGIGIAISSITYILVKMIIV